MPLNHSRDVSPGIFVALLIPALTVPVGSPVEAQAPPPCEGPVAEACGSDGVAGPAGRSANRTRSVPRGVPVLASLVLPGSGQWLQRRERGWAYVGVEALAVLGYLERTSSADHLRTRYRDLAWRSARDRSFERVEGTFEYYETLARFPSSGAWDAAPEKPGIQPEDDPTTYNGRIWQLALEIHAVEDADPDSPAYRRALEYYRERSYEPEMFWDWSSAPTAQREYRDLIEESDARFREATIALGITLGNHILSAVDAYVSGRLGADDGGHVALRSWHSPTGEPVWGVHFHFRP